MPLAGPAAFRRLCVETFQNQSQQLRLIPAAFRRLCVETIITYVGFDALIQPPSGGCVLKPVTIEANVSRQPSRLQAAVC